ncbi:SDR family NAD(P)-dependent oxidoreductase [Sphingobium vermicomposti]|uniref:NAD(P)-dependent dehydrogenase (Short-subunit alcohol dehydrogenase family) n=1 Tax=Sphingobium vermicomposti TaxID=529005 RepID=A0A846M9U5_9SPHN|nr:SDR family oxidoreductase [Sphingobium vermicomposti]NIJ18018.1 NAD(P)-dependent dehydrogenase (short-subunit alcohol dehydrogenase family) [Sphingobium vermicomposti]
MNSNRLTGRRIIVFGCATGIGAATVKRLAQEGARVCAADINIDGATQVAAEAGGETFAVHVDIADEGSVQKAVEAAVERLGGLDGAHINAADLRVIMEDSDALTVDLAVFDRTVAVNLRGHLLCTRAVLPHLTMNETSAIVYTSSGSAHGAEPVRPSYAMTKAGVNALMRHVASRWGREGVTANVLAPGFTITGEMKKFMDADPGVAKQWEEQFMTETPHTRLGQSEDHAAVVALLLSDDGRWINGSIVDVNGGSLMRG